MKKHFSNENRRRYLRFLIDLPLEYAEMDDSSLRGAMVVNASEGGFLIESPRDLPVGTELRITVLYPKGFELANFKAKAKIDWKEPYWKEDMRSDRSSRGYHYGLEFIQILDEDRWKLSLLLGEQLASEEISPRLCSQYY
jgi:PilZ domain